MFTLSPSRWPALASLAVCLAVAASGCSSGEKLYPVKGKIVLDGTELKAGNVNFVPDTAKGNKAKNAPLGQINSDGTYTVFTEGKAGAPAGWYKVTVSTMAPGMGAAEPGAATKPVGADATGGQINPKYTDPTKTDLEVEVVASPSPTQYDLKVSR